MPAGRLWVDVYDASGNRLGAGPVTNVLSAQVRRPLDGVGTFSFGVPATDKRALDLLTSERRVTIWTSNADGSKRELGAGIVRSTTFSESSGGMVRTISGPDSMDELTRRSVWLARIYKQKTLEYVAEDLIALVPGWTVSVDAGVASDLIEARFDGVSVLKALQYAVQQLGVHFRLGEGKVIEIGAFGELDGRRINRVTEVGPDALNNPLLLLVENLNAATKSDQIYNVIAPIGAGEGTASLTLEQSTRTSPYTIQSLGMPDGSTLYYLKDTASVTAYGEIQKVGQFKDIAPLSNTEGDIVNAANALYDAAVAWLTRYKDPQDSYSATIKNIKARLNPGDKVNVRYKGRVVNQDNEIVDYVDLNGDMWLMEVSETVNLSGVGASVQLSSLDRYEKTAADVVVGAIESINLRGLKPAQSSSVRSFVYTRELDTSTSAIVPVEVTDATLYVDRVRVRVRTTPFRSTALQAAYHEHTVGITNALGSGGTAHRIQINTSDGGAFAFDVTGSYVGGSSPFLETYTPGVPPVALEYGVTDDDQYPRQIQVWVNGINRTSALGGPFTNTNVATDVLLDEELMTDYILNAAGGLRQVHEIEIRCGAGRGRAEVTVEIFEVNQSIKLA